MKIKNLLILALLIASFISIIFLMPLGIKTTLRSTIEAFFKTLEVEL